MAGTTSHADKVKQEEARVKAREQIEHRYLKKTTLVGKGRLPRLEIWEICVFNFSMEKGYVSMRMLRNLKK